MKLEDLQPASYRGVPFKVATTSTAGGRKTVTKKFINSDLQEIEDLGLLQRTFSITGIVSATRSPARAGDRGPSGGEITSYQTVRDRLVEALELGGTGILVHPFLGEIRDVVCLSYTLTEDMKSLGDSSLQIEFGISNTDGVPDQEGVVLNEVFEDLGDVNVSVGTALDTLYQVTAAFLGNFEDAVDQIEGVIDAVNAATSPLAIVADQVNSFTAELADLAAEIPTLVSNPLELSDSLVSLWETMNGLYPSVRGTFEAFTRLFDFGDSDVEIQTTTAGKIERLKNRNLINTTVQGLSLAYAYANAAQLEFETVEEIDEVSTLLEDQYQKLLASQTLTNPVEEALTEERITTVAFFASQRITRPQVITVSTLFTSTRLLAFQYYGSSELGDTIAKLNGITRAVTIQGDVRILTA